MTRTQLGRPVGASGEETRRRIIAAAMRCVGDVGYSKATIREIARAADMTSGSLYHYFPTKSELLNATGEEVEGIVSHRLRAAAAAFDDVVDRLDAVLDECGQLMRDYPYLAAFLRAMRAQSNAQLRRGSPRYPGSKALLDVVTEIIEDARAHGMLAPGIGTAATAETICALARGLSEQAGTLPPTAFDATLASAKKLIRGTLFKH
ncbi:TetR family transcriptional regulator [Mycobacterium sp. IS-2888]|uniref:TetR/AcrR family transcriptional regulator n=1 Tax=Mycobacterium sp. IS-2888 TaxID=1834159 RepID=UPI00096D7E78|nr:TetR/AcrR family transcriptional regulator [Mycobacterium sp. IS-2888]OMC47574.1 TetR family transcriptional regulator [Mycobacterium sp. IS-2888]